MQLMVKTILGVRSEGRLTSGRETDETACRAWTTSNICAAALFVCSWVNTRERALRDETRRTTVGASDLGHLDQSYHCTPKLSPRGPSPSPRSFPVNSVPAPKPQTPALDQPKRAPSIHPLLQAQHSTRTDRSQAHPARGTHTDALLPTAAPAQVRSRRRSRASCGHGHTEKGSKSKDNPTGHL